jgi:hypothetical protein
MITVPTRQEPVSPILFIVRRPVVSIPYQVWAGFAFPDSIKLY